MPRRRRRHHDNGHVLSDTHAIYRPGHRGHDTDETAHTRPEALCHDTPRRGQGPGGEAGSWPTDRAHDPEPAPWDKPVDDSEAAALAWAFALDLESWDEEQPQRRAAVLARYLPDIPTGHLGWDGTGRQRSETATTGTVHRIDATHVIVDIRLRITPYLRVLPAPHPSLRRGPGHQPGGDTVPAAAPSPTALGWVPCASEWKRLRIPVTRDHAGRLVIDLSAPGTTGTSRSLPLPTDPDTEHTWH